MSEKKEESQLGHSSPETQDTPPESQDRSNLGNGARKGPEASFNVTEVSESRYAFNGGASHGGGSKIVGYDWSFGDGTSESGMSKSRVSHEYQSDGDYEVTLTVTNRRGQSDTATQGVEVDTAPPPPPPPPPEPNSRIEAPSSVETGEQITLDGSSSEPAGQIVSYEWEIPTGRVGPITKNGKQVSHAWDREGSHTVQLTVTDREGRTDTATKSIEVTGDPLPRSIVIEGSGHPGSTGYSIEVSGRLKQVEGTLDGFEVSDNSNDRTRGGRAWGSVGGGNDGFRFSGEVQDISLDDESAAAVHVNGDPERHTLVIAGSERQGQSSYEISVSGDIEQVDGTLEGRRVTDNSNDRVRGNTASGGVAGGNDGFRFTGEITDLSLDDPLAAKVYEDGNRVLAGIQRPSVDGAEYVGTINLSQYDDALCKLAKNPDDVTDWAMGIVGAATVTSTAGKIALYTGVGVSASTAVTVVGLSSAVILTAVAADCYDVGQLIVEVVNDVADQDTGDILCHVYSAQSGGETYHYILPDCEAGLDVGQIEESVRKLGGRAYKELGEGVVDFTEDMAEEINDYLPDINIDIPGDNVLPI